MTEATRVVLSYPSDLSEWGRESLAAHSFKRYLGRVHETATEGDTWEEFVGVGCCGDTLDVPLRVERVEGGVAVGDGTEFEFQERAAGAVEGGWLVQSAEGPAE